jgi:CubicO group peptidase (beta-lactamase class C family)
MKRTAALALLLATTAFATRAPAPPDRWTPLRQLLEGWEFTTEYAVSVGTAEGQLFVYESGNFTMKTQIPTGSTSKWPSAMMFAGLVQDGSITLDDPVSEYVDWWTKDPKDPRSLVTLRMLLSFTSGFGGGHPGDEGNSRAARRYRAEHNTTRSLGLRETLKQEIGSEAADACNETIGDITACAKSIYSGVKLIGTPGKVYSYNSNHLQLTAAVALAATGMSSIHALVHKYLFEPYNMTSSFYYGKKCPDFAGDLVTNGEDYEAFLQGILNYKVLSKNIIDASEEDSTPFMADYYTLYGDYGDRRISTRHEIHGLVAGRVWPFPDVLRQR